MNNIKILIVDDEILIDFTLSVASGELSLEQTKDFFKKNIKPL